MDVDELVRRAAENQRDSEARARLAYEAVEVTTELDASGRESTPEKRYFSCVRQGRALSRELLRVNERAPTDRERRKARTETDDVKTGRMDLMDMLGRFDFRYVREDVLDGRPGWLVAFTPRPRRGRTARDRVLAGFEGTAFIDAAEVQVLRIEGRLAHPVRLAAGALRLDVIGIVYEARPVAPGVWAPCREELHVEAKAGFVLPFRQLMRLDFANYRPATSGAPRI